MMTRSIGRLMAQAALMSAAAVILALPGHALAQYYYAPPPPPPPPPYYYPPPPPPRYAPPPPYAPRPPPPDDLNIFRLQVGVEGVSTGYYCYGPYYPTTCYNWFGDANLIVRGAAELNVGGAGMIMMGFDFLPSLTVSSRYFYEPTLDFGLSFRRWKSPVRSRFYLGFGLPIADTGQVGALLRIGGGASVRLAPQFAFGGDLVWSIGGINGYFVSALGLAVGPEFTF